jgi:hypothetical protein
VREAFELRGLIRKYLPCAGQVKMARVIADHIGVVVTPTMPLEHILSANFQIFAQIVKK